MSLLRPAVVLAFLLGACGGSGNGTTPAVDTDAGTDAGPEPTGMDATAEAQADAAVPSTITVSTLAPAVPGSPGGKASAAWAAWQADDGPWQVLTPTAVGTYSFAATGARWAIALACADGSSSSAVDVHRRLADTVSLEVTLEPECLVTPAAFQTLSGTLSNVPATTTWLELGYALESRGSALAVSGTSAPYELVNLAAGGMWDFAFGLRDDSGGPLTRVLLQRGKAFTVDTVLDLDFTSAFVPIPKALAVHGLDAAEIVDAAIFYSSSGYAGLAVGPQNVPTSTPDVVTTYDTVPPASQIASDHYRFTLIAAKDKTSAVVRTIEASFHAAIDVDLTLAPAIGAPTVTAKKTANSVEVSARAPVYAAAASYALVASVALNDRNRRAFRTTFTPSMVADTFVVTPDLAALPGFDPSWLLPQDSVVDVAAVAVEAPAALGDGTRTRTSSQKLSMTP